MSKSNELDRRKVVARLLADRKDAVVVPGLGSSNYDIAAAGDHDRNFYNWGAMGGASKDMPFDMKRMAYGGFKTIVE